MKEQFINYATVLAFVIACVDLIIQIRHLHKRKTSHDISLWGALMRFCAVNILLVKYSLLKDPYLVLGQLTFNGLLAVYTYQIITYRHKKSTKNRMRTKPRSTKNTKR